jgi:hypothetical protein
MMPTRTYFLGCLATLLLLMGGCFYAWVRPRVSTAEGAKARDWAVLYGLVIPDSATDIRYAEFQSGPQLNVRIRFDLPVEQVDAAIAVLAVGALQPATELDVYTSAASEKSSSAHRLLFNESTWWTPHQSQPLFEISKQLPWNANIWWNKSTGRFFIQISD